MQSHQTKSQQGYSLPNASVALKTVKVIKSKESLRNCHSQEELKEM
jgi:hypothetical protein